MRRHLVPIVLGLFVVAVFLGYAAHYYRLPLLEQLENTFYDYRVTLTMPRTVDDRVVIVDIDDKSLAERSQGGEGHWPWPRNRLALMLDQLFDHYHVAVVGFDVTFPEHDDSSGLGVLEKLGQNQLRDVPGYEQALQQLRPQLQYDEIFARSVKDRPVVLGYVFTHAAPSPTSDKGLLPPPTLPAGTFAGRSIAFTQWSAYTANLPGLERAARTAGHFNPYTDPDGMTRRVPMLAEYNGAYYQSLSLAMVRVVLGMPKVEPVFADAAGGDAGYGGLEWLKVGPLRIPVDAHAAALVPYRGFQGSFPYYSAVDVIHGRVPVNDLKGRIVLVGTTAPGLLDLRVTPVGRSYPGVEVHANLISGMLDGTIKQQPPYVTGAEFVLLLLTGALMALVLPLLAPLRATAFTLLVLGGAIAANLAIFAYGNLVLPLASGLAMILLLYAFNMAYGFFVEARGRRQITSRFGQYVPPELVDEMAKHPRRFSMAGESRELTVLFTDVRGFTTISEGLEPKELSQLMNAFLTALTEVIYKHRGTIDKYMGDCIMAFWGAPLADPGHARRALEAALDMHVALARLQPEFSARGWPEIRIGVGLNSGRMSVGNMGSEIRLAYTVMGDAVNLASRLEGLTKQYGAAIIVGENTRNTVTDVVFRELDRVRVKGKEEPVAIFEPVGKEGEVSTSQLAEVALFHELLTRYRDQDWDGAERRLAQLLAGAPENVLYRTYAQRVAFFRVNPPGDGWDGVFRFETK